MLPLRITGATRRLAEDQDEFIAISIKAVLVNGNPMMQSRWELEPLEATVLREGGALYCAVAADDGTSVPAYCRELTAGELACINAGGVVSLYVPGRAHPPVWVGVAKKDEDIQRPSAPLVFMMVEALSDVNS